VQVTTCPLLAAALQDVEDKEHRWATGHRICYILARGAQTLLEAAEVVLPRGELGAGVFRTDDGALEEPVVTIVDAPIDALTLRVAGVPQWAVRHQPSRLAPRSTRVSANRIGIRRGCGGRCREHQGRERVSRDWLRGGTWRPNAKDWNEVLMAFELETVTR
jgi:hypothetical protein